MQMFKHIKNWFRKETALMVVVYATLIIKGLKTINDVPVRIRDQVKETLIALDCPELAEKTLEEV